MIVKPLRSVRLARRKADREAEWLRRGEIRHDAIVRGRGLCEACWAPVPPGELHHILHGSGQRREQERLDTVAFLCVKCHHGWHAGHMDVMERLQAWAGRHGYAETRAAIENRLRKATREAKWEPLRQSRGAR